MAQEKPAVGTELAVLDAPQAAKRIHWKGSSQEIWVQNMDATNDAQVSFDGGTEWWTVPSGRLDRYTIAATEIHIRRVGSTNVPLEILIFLKD